MMNDLQVFNNPAFGEIRTLEEKGRVLFCGSDVARALGYSNDRDALNRHCRYVVRHDVPHPQSPDKQMEMSFIPESDVYRLIIKAADQSRNEDIKIKAEQFEHWVFDVVLPTIHKTGTYSHKPLPTIDLTPLRKCLEGMIEDTQKLSKRIEKLETLPHDVMLEIRAMHDRIDRLTPQPLPPSCLANPVIKYPITISKIAALYGMGGAALNKLLYGFKVIYRSGWRWKLYATHANQGYMELDRWTERGVELIHKTLKRHGFLTLSEKERKYQ